ncbi:heme oxygenase-like protein [Xylariaceae sp. FL0594]|nr:heme oxygenase-like protein [Xylariaceae sp. FL0594]
MPENTGSPRSLSESVNAATRSVHTKLNKLVMSRLRLALPPQADDASQYVSGLLHISPIYIAFESLWLSLLEKSSPVETPGSEQTSLTCTAYDADGASPFVHTKCDFGNTQINVNDRIQALLAGLHFQGLQRSKPLRDDLISLTNWSNRTLAEKLNDATEATVLSKFLDHIKSHVEGSPHVLLAYAWVLYMALFSGGRFIRSKLESILTNFWVPASASAQGQAPTGQPFGFFRFDTPEDGEDLKLEFKRRLVESESVLTPSEREDIVREAQSIFDFMIRLVDELDDICGTDREAAESRLLSLRSRDSVVVEKERRQHIAQLKKKIAEEKQQTDSGGTEAGHVKFD